MTISEWWPKLSEDVRAALVADPGKKLTASEVVAITHARGVGPAGAYWVGQPTIDHHLLGDEQRWIEEHGAPSKS